MPKAGRALFVIMATNPAIADEAFLQDVGLVVSINLAKANSLLRKTWETYRLGYKTQPLYK